MASHPIVGAWLVRNPTDPPTASPASFTADGIMTIAWAPNYVDPQLGAVFQATAIGTWEPTGERSIRFTVVQALADGDGTYLGTFTLDGYPVVGEDGLCFLDDGTEAKATIRDADDNITMEAGGGARRRRRRRCTSPGSGWAIPASRRPRPRPPPRRPNEPRDRSRRAGNGPLARPSGCLDDGGSRRHGGQIRSREIAADPATGATTNTSTTRREQGDGAKERSISSATYRPK